MMPSAFFGPQDLDILRGAYQQACHALRFAFLSHDAAIVEKTQDELARLVIDVARTSQQDASKISMEALRRMPPLQANWLE
jgi:hypothetical protein